MLHTIHTLQHVSCRSGCYIQYTLYHMCHVGRGELDCTYVTIVHYRSGLGWLTIGRGGLRALWHVDRGLL